MRTRLRSASPLFLIGCLGALLAGGCEAESPEGVAQRSQPVELSLRALGAVQPDDASAGDRFGLAVSASADWLLAARYVVLGDSVELLASARTGDGWAPPSQLVPTDVADTRWLGTTLAIHQGASAEALVGTGQTDGSVLVFDLGTGVQTDRLRSPSTSRQRFGSAIAVRNEWLAVGDYLEGDLGAEPGAVHLYRREASGWTFRQSIGPEGGVASSRFGRAVALSDDYLAVGAPERNTDTTKTAGVVEMYALAGGVWTYQQTLTASAPQADSQFGYAVAISDETLFVVSRFDSQFASQAGAVHVFERSGGAWVSGDALGATSPAPRGGFGESIAFDGELLGVGEHADPSQAGGDVRGAVTTYHRGTGTWEVLERLVPDGALGSPDARFGHAVALGGDRLVVGAPDDQASATESGFVASWEIIHTETTGSCGEGIECASGHCVDGVCCDQPCDGTCVACSAAKKGQGEDGTCGPIVKGLDPDAECPADPSAANACAAESACSGEASCDCVVPGTLQCSTDDERIDENGERVSCAPYRCRANTCLTTCASRADCADGALCSSDRVCVVSSPGSSDSGGCRFVPSGEPAPWRAGLGGLGLLGLLVLRRRTNHPAAA
ncbi:MAG: hypothetical protein KC766_32315 [Myxococcales bacterium]|nr:hypothetical protein [Myxococcales bacterium]